MGLYLLFHFMLCSFPLPFLWVSTLDLPQVGWIVLLFHFPFNDWLSLAQFYIWGNWFIGKVIQRKSHLGFEDLLSASRDHAFIHDAADPETKLRSSLILHVWHSVIAIRVWFLIWIPSLKFSFCFYVVISNSTPLIQH